MKCAIMGNLDGNYAKMAFDPAVVAKILHLDTADVVFSHQQRNHYLQIGEKVLRVENSNNGGPMGPYFILLQDHKVFNVKDYQLLFDLEPLPDGLISGRDIIGRKHLCQFYSLNTALEPDDGNTVEELSRKIETGEISEKELDALKDLVSKMKQGEFFEALTMEVSGKIKEIAKELVEFRKDLQRKIEPSIVHLAEKEIPEASNQLEGINETLEKSTMRIMDINEEQLEIAQRHAEEMKALVEGGANAGTTVDPAEMCARIRVALEDLSDDMGELRDLVLPSVEAMERAVGEGNTGERLWEALSPAYQNLSFLETEEEDEALVRLKGLFEEAKETLSGDPSPGDLQRQMQAFERIAQLSLSMLEPLSFQDLVGQRIQRIVRLVKTMESKIEDLIVSFGVKLQKHREDPSLTYEEVTEEAEELRSELKGPAREGEGLNQDDIDNLLASL